MIIHELIQGIELHHPQEVLPGAVSEHLEVLHIVSKPGVRWGAQKACIGQRVPSWRPGHLPIEEASGENVCSGNTSPSQRGPGPAQHKPLAADGGRSPSTRRPSTSTADHQ